MCSEVRTSISAAGHPNHMVNGAALSASWDREAGFEIDSSLHRMVQGGSKDALVRRNSDRWAE